MKEFNCPSNIGAGLFTDDAIPTKINFPDGAYAEVELYALTPSKIVAFKKEGIKMDNIKNDAEALEQSLKILNKIVKVGTYYPVEGEPIAINSDNNRRLVDHIGLINTIIMAARNHAEEQVVEDLKNSES